MRVALCLAFFTLACGNDGPAVPFGLDPAQPDPDEGVDEASESTGPGEPLSIQTFAQGTREVEVEGARLSGSGLLRALWAHDADGDGDRDAFSLTTGEDNRIHLHYHSHEGSRFLPPVELGASPTMATDCAMTAPTFERIDDRHTLARAVTTCSAANGHDRLDLWVFNSQGGANGSPRALIHSAALGPSGRSPGELSLAVEAADRDEDGHDDMVLRVTIGSGDREEMQLELPWLNRPSGFARDRSEPEATFERRSRRALRLLRRNADAAVAESNRILHAHALLCREASGPRLELDGSVGIGCGESDAVGRAAATAARGLAAGGHVVEALDAAALLSQRGIRNSDDRREALETAFASIEGNRPTTTRAGPPHRAPDWNALRRTALAFDGPNAVILRGSPARRWDLNTDNVTPVDDSAAGDMRELDPSGALVAVSIERDCQGYVLTIASATSLIGGSLVGPIQGRALIAPRDAETVNCQELPASLRTDTGGWQMLGWAPQGIVLANRNRIRVVALDTQGAAAAEPVELADNTLPPAPLTPGRASNDARYHVEVRGAGVLVHDVRDANALSLFWPPGWSPTQQISEAAVSPDGRRVAVLRDGHVVLLAQD